MWFICIYLWSFLKFWPTAAGDLWFLNINNPIIGIINGTANIRSVFVEDGLMYSQFVNTAISAANIIEYTAVPIALYPDMINIAIDINPEPRTVKLNEGVLIINTAPANPERSPDINIAFVLVFETEIPDVSSE